MSELPYYRAVCGTALATLGLVIVLYDLTFQKLCLTEVASKSVQEEPCFWPLLVQSLDFLHPRLLHLLLTVLIY